MAGGNITATAQYGNVNTGASPYGYLYHVTAPYYTVNSAVGGISTPAGGNVDITAGGNISSYLPVSAGGVSSIAITDAGSGAFGPEPGNVTLTAGGSIYGHYVLANGIGNITAGQNIGAPTGNNSFALSLIDGSWTVTAEYGKIYLQEVRNPNGTFNNLTSTRGGAAVGKHLFNYGPADAVLLNAPLGGVYLTDVNIPRDGESDEVPVLYPPTLDIQAGPGGVTLQDNVTLFPSPDGNLSITTTRGGNFMAVPNDPTANPSPELLMSDSSQTRWLGAGTFTDGDHGDQPD